MRRPLALLVLVAFAAATAAPAIAACRMRAALEECCCDPAPSNAICAPDCCDTAKPAHRIGELATHLRGFAFVAPPTLVLSLALVDGAHGLAPPTPGALVGLHERAAPRLPLRI
ncbi:MAG: hypothetical protein ACXVDD_21275 [Polyangia bacterium]